MAFDPLPRTPSPVRLAVDLTESHTLEAKAVALPGIDEGEIVVIRSPRRKRHISAYRQAGRIVISIPARLSKADERAIIPEMVAKIRAQEAARTPGEIELAQRIDELLTAHAPEISERPNSVHWRSMRQRWGSCTSVDGSIRISDRLKQAPEYVLDFLLFHESIHLRYADHGEQFQEVMDRFPEGAKAQAYLDGYEAAEDALIPPELD